MTIGIGVLATENKAAGVEPTHIVLLADTMGSFGDEFSHPRLHKTFVFDETELYATAADKVEDAAILLPMINEALLQVPKDERSFGDFIRIVSQTLFIFKIEKFNLTILPKFGLPPATIAPHSRIKAPSLMDALAATPQSIHGKLQEEWENMSLGCELLIANLDKKGQATLLYVPSEGGVFQNVTFPGFFAIGSGAGNAMFWLSYRAHTLGMHLKRAAYHAYEAKLMAEGSAHVNEHLDIIVATKGKSWNYSTHRKDASDCPIQFDELRKWYGEYGPTATNNLDE